MVTVFSKEDIEQYSKLSYQCLEECLIDMCCEVDENNRVILNRDFEENAVYSGNCFDGFFEQIQCCRFGNKLWVEIQKLGDSHGFYKDWSVKKYMQTMYEICQITDEVFVNNFDYSDDDSIFSAFFIDFLFDIEQFKYYEEVYKYCHTFCDQLDALVERKIRGCYWDGIFEKDEMAFCKFYLTPFFKNIGFEQVLFTHGNKEFGKDYILVTKNIFGQTEYYGVQAKAGNMSGSATSNINEISDQIDIGFLVPYKLVNGEEVFVSKMIIAISGVFTDNAQTIIQRKLPKDKLANIIFLSKKELENHQAMIGH